MTPAAPSAHPLRVLPRIGDLVDHTPQSAYAYLRDTRPELFTTPPGNGAITIGSWPMTEGQVAYQDERRMLLVDPVVLPDRQPGRRIRLLTHQPGMVVLPLLDGEVVLLDHYRHATRAWHWEIPRSLATTAWELIELGKVHPDTGLLADPVLLYAARIDEVGDIPHDEGIRQVRTVSFAQTEAMTRTGEITDVFTIAALMHARLTGLGG
ncbi:hypothetical protein [Streptomyces sp900116325]|uniref:NUDIX hydrolase n=1 Tax=Streptomyces sp. 900116325 TaxID=3154295 RepID=UPI0033B1C05B